MDDAINSSSLGTDGDSRSAANDSGEATLVDDPDSFQDRHRLETLDYEKNTLLILTLIAQP